MKSQIVISLFTLAVAFSATAQTETNSSAAKPAAQQELTEEQKKEIAKACSSKEGQQLISDVKSICNQAKVTDYKVCTSVLVQQLVQTNNELVEAYNKAKTDEEKAKIAQAGQANADAIDAVAFVAVCLSLQK